MPILPQGDNKQSFFPYGLIAPAFIILIVMAIFPLIYALNLSFHSWNLAKPQYGYEFVGLRNFMRVLSDPRFYQSLRTTGVFTFVAVSLEFLIGFGIAILVNRKLKGGRIIRSLLLIPMIVPPVVVGFVWRFMYNPSWGIINYFSRLARGPEPLWLSNASIALFSVIFVDIWQWTPFIFVILLAGLSALPEEQYEAAKVDGASNFQVFWYITLPLLRSVILVALLIRTMDAIKAFDIIYLLTLGGPRNVTEVLSVHAYLWNFRKFYVGYGAALCLIILAIVILISQVLIRLLAKAETK